MLLACSVRLGSHLPAVESPAGGCGLQALFSSFIFSKFHLPALQTPPLFPSPPSWGGEMGGGLLALLTKGPACNSSFQDCSRWGGGVKKITQIFLDLGIDAYLFTWLLWGFTAEGCRDCLTRRGQLQCGL